MSPLDSPIYIRPNLEEDITLTDVFLSVSTSNPNYKIVKLVQDIANSNSKHTIQHITFSELLQHVMNVAKDLEMRLANNHIPILPRKPGTPQIVVAMLGTNGYEFYVNILACLLNRWTIFPMSPKNSLAGMVHLLESSKAVALLIDAPFCEIAEELTKSLPKLCVQQFSSSSVNNSILVSESSFALLDRAETELEKGIPVMCMHTSGSTVPSGSWFLEYADALQDSIVLTPPSLIEDLYQLGDEAVRSVANNVYQVLFVGAPLNKTVGDTLTAKGLNLSSGYGSTELGNVTFFHEKPLEDWEYVRFRTGYNWAFLPVGDDPNLKELVACVGKDTPAVLNSDNPKGFTANDVWEQHPRTPYLWKHHSRKGNLLVLANGEKTDPKQLENYLLEDNRIRFAQVFGEGKRLNGVLLQPAFAVDPETFINEIELTIERVNSLIPQHSRVIPELIIIAKPDKPFSLTDKLTVRTAETLQSYAPEIEEAYKNLEEGVSTNESVLYNGHPMNFEETKQFLREIIKELIHKTPDDEADFFLHGLDSLLAIRLRSLIAPVVKSFHIAKSIPFNVIYTHPTINSLAAFMSASNGAGDGVTERDIDRIIEEYSSNLSRNPIGTVNNHQGLVIAVTGTTGNLGCALLKDLLMRNDVAKVYALNRPGNNKSQFERHLESFREKGLDTEILENPRVVYVDVDLSKPGLGIPKDQYEELRGSVTHILHAAWTLNFIYTLESYEKIHIPGVCHLIDLALSSPRQTPPRFVFISSISAVMDYKSSSHVPETPIDDPSISSDMGYGQSKYVGERILVKATMKSGLPVTIIRIGQLSGYTTNGAWTLTEHVPIIIRSSVELGMIPNDIPVELKFLGIHYLPTDIGSLAVIQQTIKSSDNLEYFHVENTAATPWNEMVEAVQAIAQQRPLKIVSLESWLSHISSQADIVDPVKVPAIHLLDFYREAFKNEVSVRLETKHSVQIAPEIAYGVLSKELLQKYVAFQLKC
ncbi:putative secondary metabolism biosyntheticenzyme [Clathrus columnatus]|uniref:Secondary metabolism biosyntheticenzyme n=1 Tax=Clathrus columnatus TaxID=1419009 RepID=A0AAV5ANY7_9AGAM|nr:putative secondary metabolism biosyntheticenzyme [Clathrus columnatus]